eukprot:22689-Eustigmatos_ZCMA.PRE.1
MVCAINIQAPASSTVYACTRHSYAYMRIHTACKDAVDTIQARLHYTANTHPFHPHTNRTLSGDASERRMVFMMVKQMSRRRVQGCADARTE